MTRQPFMVRRMKRGRSLAIVLILLAAAACGGPASSTPVPTNAAIDPLAVDWDDRALFRRGLIAPEQGVLEGLPGASVYHIDLRIPPDMAVVRGHEEVRYSNQEGVPLDGIYFQLLPNASGGRVTVSAVQVDGQEIQPAYEFHDTALYVPLATPLQPGEHIVVQMDFTAEVPREMGGNFGLFGYFNEILVLDTFYPVIPVYDDEGWNAGELPPNGDWPYFDASFYLVRVSAPVKLVVVASGVEVSRETAGETLSLVFAAGPARDFYLAASEHFAVISGTVGDTMVNSYAIGERKEGARLVLQAAENALRHFSERFGPYPYTEFDAVSTPMLALGIEYPGMSGIALRLYDPDEVVSGLPAHILIESVVAHEVAHQWFYNAVGNDQVDEAWLDEALAQYLTGLYYVDVQGESAARSYRESWDNYWERVDRAEIPIGLPSAAYGQKEYSPIVYGRGPIFVTALAEEMGPGTFDEFLRDYYQTYKWGIGTGEGFRKLAEEHCQCDLSALFEEWVYGK